MPEMGEGIADRNARTKNICCTPNRARAGAVRRFLHLHASPSPPLAEYTAVDMYSSTCHTAGHALVYCLLCRDVARALLEVLLCWDLHLYDTSPSLGASDPFPGEPLHAPRSPSWSSEPVFSPGPQRFDVWDGSGATARPLEAKWRSGVAAVVWIRYN